MKNYSSDVAKRIETSFLSLLLEHNFSSITVKDITNNANINRTSFYVYWTNTEDLLEYICSNFLSDCVDQLTYQFRMGNRKLQKKMLHNALTFINDNQATIKSLWSVTDASFSPFNKMQESIEETIYKCYKVQFTGSVPDKNIIMFSKYYAASTLATIKCWLENDSLRDLDFMIDVIDTCSTKGINHLVFLS